jgi:hypothetical protein
MVRRARIGLGLFAARVLPAGRTIIHVEGRIVDADLLWDVGGTFADNCYRFGPETYLDPGDTPGRYVNHSCRPNAGVRKSKNRLYLFAVAPIPRGREITIDYSTILGDDDIWTMRCRCGERTCRGRIRNFGALPQDLRNRYIRSGMVPGYILRAPAI